MNREARDTVSGIIVVKGRFMVEQRRVDDAADPNLIAIPGGHVETGESLRDALAREMKEELGIEVKKAQLVAKDFYLASDGERQRIHYFVIEEWEGEPRSLDATRIFWESDTNRLSMPDKKVVTSVLAGRQNPGTASENRQLSRTTGELTNPFAGPNGT